MKKTFILTLSAMLAAGFLFGTTPVPVSAETATPEIDNVLVETYDFQSGVIGAPTVVVDAVDKATLDSAIGAEKKPSNVILRVDENANVLSQSGEVVDSFTNVYTALDKKIIPILHVSNEGQADGFIKYFKETKTILDIAVMSSDETLVRKVKDVYPSVRGIVELPDSMTKEDMVRVAQEAEAMTIVVSQSFATVDNVSYLQGMFKTVWVRVDGTDTMNISDAVFSGAYGLIAQNAAPMYAFMESLPEKTYVRSPFIVAHRGDVQNCNENSLSGIVSSAEGGATHVELDFHVTKDKKVVAMHDTSLTRTTNGTGEVKNLTLEQIRNYKIDDHATAEPEIIPTLEECVEAILETDMIFVLELKCSGKEIVTLVHDILTSDDTLSAIFDRMVVITFYTDQLEEMQKVMPQVPTANLNTASQATIRSTLEWMGKYNTGIDTSNSHITAQFQNTLKARGIIDWSYTYSTYNDVVKAQQKGAIGLTTNQPTTYSEVAKTVRLTQKALDGVPEMGAEVDVTVESYGSLYTGLSEKVKGKIAYVEDGFFEFKAIASVEIDGYTYYTQSITVEKGHVLPLLICGIVGGVLLLGGGTTAAILLLKKRKPQA